MIRPKCRGNRKLIILIFSTLLLGSCNKEDPKEHLQKGVEYFNKGEYEKAVLELKTASQSDKNTAETYYYLALLDEKNRQYKAMIENLKKTIELSPSHTGARLKLGKVQLLLGQPDAALEQAEFILKGESQNLDALLLKASVFTKQKKYTEALAIVNGVLTTNPGFSDALMLNALIYMETERFNDALTLINTAIKLDTSNVALRLFKIQLDAKTRNSDAVVADYHELVSLYPDNQEFKIILAKIYAQTGKKAEAEELLKGLIAAKPDDINLKLLLLDFLAASNPERVQEQFRQFTEQYKDKSKTLLAFATWSIAQKNFDEAKKVLNRLIDLDEDIEQVLSAKMILAKIAFDVKDFETSEKIVAEVLAANSNYIDAKVFQARLLLTKKQYDDAIDLLSKVLWEKPGSEETLILLAQSFTIKGDQKQAEKQFLRVLEVNPTNSQALKYIYDKALAVKDVNYAQEIIEKALRVEPENLVLLERLVKLNLLASKWDNAKGLIQRILNSNNPQAKNLAKYLQGQIFQEQGDYVKAIELYKELVVDIPGNYEVLVNMVRCYEGLNKKDDMIVFLNNLLAKDHQNISASIILSNLLVKDKQFDKSSLLLTNLIEKNKKLSELYASLAQIKLAQGDNKAAIAIYQDGLQQNPGDVKLLLSLATLYEIQGDYDSAISTYETLLTSDPNLDLAINNLAAILTDRYTSEEKLEKAVQLTEKFKDSIQPYYKDTYAWAMIKQGDSRKGLSLLNQIITSAPDVPIFRYHLGVAYYKNGNNSAAIAELRQALELAAKKGGFPDEKAAELLLNEIMAKTKRTKDNLL
ncbi:MAG: tetratricopeptide repeat protein [Methylobacter sp.]|nr:tetratricopeptide repeat protein [Methylobacter sp.]